MNKLFFVSLILLLGGTSIKAQDPLNYILEKHFEAHQQMFWEGIKALSVKGIWLSIHGSYPATFYFKKPDKYLMINQKARFIEAWDGVQSWTIAKWSKSSIAELSAEETLINRAIFSFGSPLNGAKDIVNKGTVFLDHVPHYWIIEDQGDLLIEYFSTLSESILKQFDKPQLENEIH